MKWMFSIFKEPAKGLLFVLLFVLMCSFLQSGPSRAVQPISFLSPDSAASYNKASSLFPGYLEGYLEKSKLLMALGRYKEALAISDSALLMGENAESYYIQAKINEALGETERASWAYSKAIQSDSTLFIALMDYTSMLLRLGNVEEAILIINDAVKAHPRNADLIFRHSEIYSAAGKLQNSINDMSLMIDWEPENSLYILYRGKFRYQAKEYDLAIEDLQKCISSKPAAAWYYIGSSRMELAQEDSARSAFHRCLVSALPDSPDSVYIRQSREKLYVLNKRSEAPLVLPQAVDSVNAGVSVIFR